MASGYSGLFITATVVPGVTGRTKVEFGRAVDGGGVTPLPAGRGTRLESGCAGLMVGRAGKNGELSNECDADGAFAEKGSGLVIDGT